MSSITSVPERHVIDQARTEAVQTQLAITTAELQEMKLRQQQLELLLQQAHISQDPVTKPAVQQVW